MRSPAGTSRLIESLATAGLVTRTPDPNDRRANLLRLTPEGRAAVRNIEIDMDAFRERVLADADPADIEAAMRVLAIIKAKAASGEALDPAA